MPHEYRTNVDAVGAKIVAQIATFGFTSTHEGRALGELLVDETVEGIVKRSRERQCDGEGNYWPPNTRKRIRAKARRNGECLTNFDTGQMLSVESLKGTVTITQYLVTIAYGTGEVGKQPTREAARYAYARNVDTVAAYVAAEAVTDDDKAFYAAQQHRAFYQLDETIKATNFAVFTDALGAHMKNTGR